MRRLQPKQDENVLSIYQKELKRQMSLAIKQKVFEKDRFDPDFPLSTKHDFKFVKFKKALNNNKI